MKYGAPVWVNIWQRDNGQLVIGKRFYSSESKARKTALENDGEQDYLTDNGHETYIGALNFRIYTLQE